MNHTDIPRLMPLLMGLMLAMMANCLVAAEVEGDRILGVWAVSGKPAIVTMVKTDSGYQGTITSNSKKPETVGRVVFRDLQFDAKTSKWTGSVYAMERQEWRDVEISMPADSAFNMTVHVGLFSKSLEWQRIPSAAAAQ
jgi:uncharacterized protein (DUF2147 family)